MMTAVDLIGLVSRVIAPMIAIVVIIAAVVSLRGAVNRARSGTSGNRVRRVLSLLGWLALGTLAASAPDLAGAVTGRRGSWSSHLYAAPEPTLAVMIIGLTAAIVVLTRTLITVRRLCRGGVAIRA